MRKTAKLLLLMILFFLLTPNLQISSSGTSTEISNEKVIVLRRYKEQYEEYRRFKVESTLYNTLLSKPSLKWAITGFVEAQQFHESSGKQSAISPKGAIGKAQFMPTTWEFLITRGYMPWWFDIHNEWHQQIAQLIYLDYLYTLFNEVANKPRKELTIASYNAGPTKIQSLYSRHGTAWKQFVPKETRDYLIKLKKFI